MNLHEALTTLPGIWRGTSRLWVMPGDPVRQSPSTASVEAVAGEGTLAVRYTWEYDGTPQDGLLLVRLAPVPGEIDMVWVDSWHQRAAYLLCRGETVEPDHVTARGDYPAPTGPPWGWRIGLHVDGADRFRLVMHNISPEGAEMVAVEAEYARAEG
jgi:hypothetical protein